MRAFFIAGLVDAHKHGEAWVATVDDAIVGGAIWLPPGSYPPGTGRQLRQLAHLLAVAPLALTGSLFRSLRYLRKVEAVHPTAPALVPRDARHRSRHQGKGYGARLLEAVLPAPTRPASPTYLETDKERNLAYYARHRFTEMEKLFPVAGGPPTWTMWREPVEP